MNTIKGINIQIKKMMLPIVSTNICTIIPNIIITILNNKPKNLEKILEIKVPKNSPTSNPFGYLQLYLLQGEKRVFIKRGMEKKLEKNEI